jgi:hypothetical protein
VLTDRATEHRALLDNFVEFANKNRNEEIALIFKYNLLKTIIDEALKLDYVKMNDGGNR